MRGHGGENTRGIGEGVLDAGVVIGGQDADDARVATAATKHGVALKQEIGRPKVEKPCDESVPDEWLHSALIRSRTHAFVQSRQPTALPTRRMDVGFISAVTGLCMPCAGK